MFARKQEIITAARSEAARMKGAVAEAADDARVAMNARQFSTLAGLIDDLCEIALDTIVGNMGDPRYWVPLEEYARLKRRYQAQERELADARENSFDNLLGGVAGTLDLQALQAGAARMPRFRPIA